ncbi:hypothetical protein ACFQZI_02235 [Mucilaginibacter lutimaris]|uniref:Uncharacterized protein n=1 Tax=Mucilaginibacter lutimaris TaxID=931629 RepID=A0ABW2ZAE9_9SPHI
MIQQYINSGILEAYVTGSASEQEVQELLQMKTKYPEVNNALEELEKDMELLAQSMAITPPTHTWGRISNSIDEIMMRQPSDAVLYNQTKETNQNGYAKPDNGPHYIEVEAANSYMKVHKAWKWVFAAVFILGKIFLGCAIYFYLENRQAQQQINQLKTELRQLKK